MRYSRDTWLTIGIILLLSLMSIVFAIQQARTIDAPPLANDSNLPDGGKALRLWLEAVGFEVDTQTLTEFAPPENTDLILILQPTELITGRDLDALDEWVRDGGLLLVAGDSVPATQLFDYFDFEVLPRFPREQAYVAQHPALGGPMSWESAEILPNAVFTSERDDFVALLALDGNPLIISVPEGDGTLILSTTAQPFTNLGLQQTGNAPLALNLILTTLQSGRIWFDEWHHGTRELEDPDAIVGIERWILETPLGQALLYLVAVVFLILLIRGRGFGRPIPLPNTQQRRAPLEYITAIANLNRRAGNRAEVLADYRLRLKRQLGQRYRLDPTLPDDVYLQQLSAANPALDVQGVQKLLIRLQNSQLSETQLVEIAGEISELLRRD